MKPWLWIPKTIMCICWLSSGASRKALCLLTQPPELPSKSHELIPVTDSMQAMRGKINQTCYWIEQPSRLQRVAYFVK